MFPFSYADIQVWPTRIYISMQKIKQAVTWDLACFTDESPGGRVYEFNLVNLHWQPPWIKKPSQQGGLEVLFLFAFDLNLLFLNGLLNRANPISDLVEITLQF
jgi:hypothetical protein